jgi:hypothetical protein
LDIGVAKFFISHQSVGRCKFAKSDLAISHFIKPSQ